jgi:hypothetical protein
LEGDGWQQDPSPEQLKTETQTPFSKTVARISALDLQLAKLHITVVREGLFGHRQEN